MIELYVIENGVYNHIDSFNKYGEKLHERIKLLLEDHEAQHILTCTTENVIKQQYEKTIDGV